MCPDNVKLLSSKILGVRVSEPFHHDKSSNVSQCYFFIRSSSRARWSVSGSQTSKDFNKFYSCWKSLSRQIRPRRDPSSKYPLPNPDRDDNERFVNRQCCLIRLNRLAMANIRASRGGYRYCYKQVTLRRCSPVDAFCFTVLQADLSGLFNVDIWLISFAMLEMGVLWLGKQFYTWKPNVACKRDPAVNRLHAHTPT